MATGFVPSFQGLRWQKDSAAARLCTTRAGSSTFQVFVGLKTIKLETAARPPVHCSASLDVSELAAKKYIFLGSQKVGDEGARAVARALSTPGNEIVGVNLDSCKITCEGAKALATGLKGNQVLEELVLLDNEIGDDGAVALAEALATAPSALRVLSLPRNRIGEVGGAALGNALKTNVALQTIYLMGMNRKEGGGMGDVGAAAWAEGIAANEGKFWFVNLDGNNVSDTMLETLRGARVGGKHTVFPVDSYPR